MNENETKLFVEDAKSILIQHRNKHNLKISKSELISGLRNTRRGGAWFNPESGRGWRLNAYFVNGELDDILEDGGVFVEHQRTQPNIVGNTTILRTYFSI